eukprot:bmy_06563T0
MVSALGQHLAESMQTEAQCLQEPPGGTTMGVKGFRKITLPGWEKKRTPKSSEVLGSL